MDSVWLTSRCCPRRRGSRRKAICFWGGACLAPRMCVPQGGRTTEEKMMLDAKFQRIVRAAALMGCSLVMACAIAEPGPPSWEAFQRQAARVVDGRTIYVVEWDLRVTFDQLRDYYETN